MEIERSHYLKCRRFLRQLFAFLANDISDSPKCDSGEERSSSPEEEGTHSHRRTTAKRSKRFPIVCGISAMVMGSVAFIEERQKFNMGLGIPAGGISVLAAAVSIHTSRGWSAMSGVAGAGAGAASVLWAAAACLLVALVVQCCRTILDPPGIDHGDGPTEEDTTPSSRDLVVIACVQIALAAATLLSAAFCARIDCGT